MQTKKPPAPPTCTDTWKPAVVCSPSGCVQRSSTVFEPTWTQIGRVGCGGRSHTSEPAFLSAYTGVSVAGIRFGGGFFGGGLRAAMAFSAACRARCSREGEPGEGGGETSAAI